MSLNRVLVATRLDLIRSCIDELAALRRLPREEFLQPRNVAAAESFLRRALEAVFDVGRHILAKRRRLDLSQEFKAIARGLGEIGAVDAKLSDRLVEMAGYRNRLVHFYHEVTPDELRDILRNDLADLEAFIQQTLRYVDRDPGDP